jgi:predicted TPR repeat methyltransferase
MSATDFTSATQLAAILGAQYLPHMTHMANGITPVESRERSAYHQALQFRAAGQLLKAEEACRAALRQNPRHGASLHLLAGIAYGSGRTEEALDLLARAAEASPQDAGLLAELGLMRLLLNRAADAIPVLRRAIALDPRQAVVHNNLGVALKETGHLDEAEAQYRKAVTLDQRYAPAHHNLGEVLHLMGKLQNARPCFETALELDSRLTQARISLANLLHDQGEFQAAAVRYREAIAASSSPAWLYTSLGIILKDMGDRAGSLEAFRQSLHLNPELAEAHLNLGFALLEFGRATEAVTSAQNAIRLKPDLDGAHGLYCAALAATGALDEAVAALKKGLPTGTTEGQCLELLGINLMNARLRREALKCFEKRLEMEPNNINTRHYVAALRGQTPDRPADEYVQKVFDQYAETFDQNLVGELGYSVPRDLVEAVLAEKTGAPRPWDILDLGCGTGLVGVEISAHARTLVGVDLSPKMLDVARRREIYTQLHCAELLANLNAERAAGYDIVIAGDVFVYVGKLDSVIPAVRCVLRPGGLFAFTVEAAEESPMLENSADETGFALGATGRYVHKAEYLKVLAADSDFEVRLMRKTRLRSERRRPVWGWLTVLAAGHPA